MKHLLTFLALPVLFASLGFCMETAATAPSGALKIQQDYKNEEFKEELSFADPKIQAVTLEGSTWPGHYSISPDENWILRIQKTGSGDNIAILYRVEKNGRVSEILGFNCSLWATSDKTSRLKTAELYHTGVVDHKWSPDHKRLVVQLRGSNANKSGDGITTALTYDLEAHTVTMEPKE
jgi:hypothetical protein